MSYWSAGEGGVRVDKGAMECVRRIMEVVGGNWSKEGGEAAAKL